ncbi:hypothetical protein CUC15_09685 [Oceanobacillus zhaokaii]|uniref:Uncharacterized protein n=1 Tax=Oceanobacillus zhaokaii TaxID=2052660 RepID=A0A345PGQ1_9BACI|nr:hypothetical protein [Oceanobacillus zhaokaii]AXI09181.1 hypothetical protein CUC15_09685 [Oceanobacillus zhaokaii]
MILSEYGYVKVNTNNNDYLYGIESWLSDGKPAYPYSIEYPKPIHEVDKKYIEAIDKAQELNKELKKLEEEKAKSNVGELWDSL